MLELLKSFKLSINRVEFKITEDLKIKQSEGIKDNVDSITQIKDSILNCPLKPTKKQAQKPQPYDSNQPWPGGIRVSD